MNILLTTKQHEELKVILKKTKNIGDYQRLSTLISYDKGIQIPIIASVLNIGESTVYRYIAEFKEDKKINQDDRGGSESKINEEQTKELVDHLTKKTYLNTKTIIHHVQEKYKVNYSLSGMAKWLKTNNFRYKKPVIIPGKLDAYQQKLFTFYYEDLKKNLKENEEIYFADAVHPAHQCQAVSGWIPIGEKKHLPTTAKQTRLHFIGAVSLGKELKLITEEVKTADSENFISFCKKLEMSSTAQVIYLILDNAMAHKSKKSKEYLIHSKIKPIYLPPYSPNLNIIERLWKIMREIKIYNKHYEEFPDFANSIRSFFKNATTQYLDILKRRLNDSFQMITPHLLALQKI